MAKVIITLKIMPASPDTDLAAVQEKAKEKIKGYAGETEIRAEEEPVAFGLKALKFTFAVDEEKGGTDDLELEMKEVDGVQSCECVGVSRALG